MADQKLTQLTTLASLSADDLFYVVDDPAGAALSRKMAASVLDSRYLQSANNLSDLASAAAARISLGLVIGTNVQAWDADLDTIAGLAQTDGNFIVGDGAAWVVESGATARTSLGLGTLAVLNSPLPIANGGSGQTTQQAAIDALTNVSAATDEYVLTKDTATGNAIFKASGSGTTLPVVDTTAIVKGSVDPTKTLFIEVDGFTAPRTMTPPNQNFLAAGQDFANVFTALQSFSGTDHAGIKLNHLTTPQRDLLSASAGMLIYNSTSAEFQGYNAAWGTIPVLPIIDTTSLLYKSGSPSFTAKFSLTLLSTARTFTLPDLDGTLLTTVWLNDVNANVHVLEGLYGVYIDQAPNAGGLVLQGASAANTLKVVFKESGSEVAAFEWDNGANLLGFRGIKSNSAVKFTSNNSDRLYISSGGFIGIGTGTTTPRGQLDVKQSSTTAAIPVIELEQLDVDQPFVEFVTTIGTGNAIEAVGAKTLTATHFIMVKLPGGLTRYFPVGTIA